MYTNIMNIKRLAYYTLASSLFSGAVFATDITSNVTYKDVTISNDDLNILASGITLTITPDTSFTLDSTASIVNSEGNNNIKIQGKTNASDININGAIKANNGGKITLFVNDSSNTTANFNLGATGSINGNVTFTIGQHGIGNFNLNGGTINITNDVKLADRSDGMGNLVINSGSLTMTGKTITANDNSGSGSITVNGGELNLANIRMGNGTHNAALADSFYKQTAGTTTLTGTMSFATASGTNSSAEIFGGSLSAKEIILSQFGGTASMKMSAGNLTVTDALRVGGNFATGAAGTGSLDISGVTASLARFDIGYNAKGAVATTTISGDASVTSSFRLAVGANLSAIEGSTNSSKLIVKNGATLSTTGTANVDIYDTGSLTFKMDPARASSTSSMIVTKNVNLFKSDGADSDLLIVDGADLTSAISDITVVLMELGLNGKINFNGSAIFTATTTATTADLVAALEENSAMQFTNFDSSIWGEVGLSNLEYQASTGKILFNLSVPEPSTYAAIFGALALALAVYRRRK